MIWLNIYIFKFGLELCADELKNVYDGGTVVEFKVTMVARWWRLKSRWWHGGGVSFQFFTVVARWWSSIFLTEAVVEVILTTVQTSTT